MMEAQEWFIQVKRFIDDFFIEEIGPLDQCSAYKVNSGLNTNLDHKNYYTLLVKRKRTQRDS